LPVRACQPERHGAECFPPGDERHDHAHRRDFRPTDPQNLGRELLGLRAPWVGRRSSPRAVSPHLSDAPAQPVLAQQIHYARIREARNGKVRDAGHRLLGVARRCQDPGRLDERQVAPLSGFGLRTGDLLTDQKVDVSLFGALARVVEIADSDRDHSEERETYRFVDGVLDRAHRRDQEVPPAQGGECRGEQTGPQATVPRAEHHASEEDSRHVTLDSIRQGGGQDQRNHATPNRHTVAQHERSADYHDRKTLKAVVLLRKDSCGQSYPQTRVSSTTMFVRCPKAFDAEPFLDNPLAAWLIVAAASSSLPEPWWRSWRAPPFHRRHRLLRPSPSP